VLFCKTLKRTERHFKPLLRHFHLFSNTLVIILKKVENPMRVRDREP